MPTRSLLGSTIARHSRMLMHCYRVGTLRFAHPTRYSLVRVLYVARRQLRKRVPEILSDANRLAAAARPREQTLAMTAPAGNRAAEVRPDRGFISPTGFCLPVVDAAVVLRVCRLRGFYCGLC
jgi:hypothetical protein